MKVKRFFAKSMQAGMKEISQVLGPDAVILNNHKVEGGVEIVAGVDVELTKNDSPKKNQVPSKYDEKETRVDLSNHSVNKKWDKSEIIKSLKPKLSDEKSISELLSELREHALPEENNFDEIQSEKKVVKKSKLESMMDSDPSFANSARSLQNKLTSNSSQSYSNRAQSSRAKTIERPKEELQTNEVDSHLTASIEAMIEKNQTKQSDQFNVMQSEIGELKSKVVAQQKQIEEQKQTRRQNTQNLNSNVINNSTKQYHEYWRNSLNEFGLSTKVGHSLLTKLKKQRNISWSSIAKSLVTQMSFTKEDVCQNGGVFTFLGPTGAGKSTSIGKLASQYVLKNGKSKVGIICMDHHQIGAQASLKLMADILDVTFLNVAKEDSLSEALKTLKDKSLVLIDTGGSALSVNDYLEQYILAQSKHEIQHLLCLPSTASTFSLNQYLNLIKIIPIYSSIITKLDESICAGSAISCILEQQYSTSYLTFGQSIPKDINHANAKGLFSFIDEFKHISHQHNNELVG